MRVIEFIKKYWGTAKEIVLVLAAILYFAIGIRITPLVERIDAVEREQVTDRKALDSFIVATDQRLKSNEATITLLDKSNSILTKEVEKIDRNIERLLNFHTK